MTRRRWWVVGGAGALAVVVAAAAVLWWVWLPHWRPGLRAGEAYAVDVSDNQGPIDWPAVRADHVGVAYVKATEGSDVVDSRFARNSAGARAAGLTVVPYHFFGFCSTGTAQAQNLLRTLGSARSQVALDLEVAGNCHARPTPAEEEPEVRAFLTAVEAATGRPVLLYVGDDYARAYPFVTTLPEPTWVRRLYLRPGGGWTTWQASDRAHVRGIPGRVDLDVVRS